MSEPTQPAESFTLLLTGLPNSGKSTLAAVTAAALTQLGRKVQVLDGAEVRATLSRDLGFDRQGRRTQAERLAFLASLLNSHGVDVIIAAITPYAEDRAIIAESVERFGEIAVVCKEETCRARDDDGLWKRADAGEVANFTGVSDPYEAPGKPMAAVINDKGTPEQGGAVILQALAAAGWVAGVEDLDIEAATYTEEDEEEIAKRLADLGYL